MKRFVLFFALAAAFVSTAQEASAQRYSSREKPPAQQCFEQITRVPRFRSHGLEIRRFCEPMNNRLQNHCLEVLTANRIFALRARGITWSPGYDTLALCGRVQTLDQHRAVQALINDFGLRLRPSEMEIATRATDRQKAECFISRVADAKSTDELEACVEPARSPVQSPAQIYAAPRTEVAPAKPAVVQTQRPAQEQKPKPQIAAPVMPGFSPELSEETFFQ